MSDRVGPESEPRRSEVVAFERRLAELGLAIGQLPNWTPRNKVKRLRAIAIADQVAAEPERWWQARTQPALGLQALYERTPWVRRVRQGQRNYILVMAILACGEFPHLQGYMSQLNGSQDKPGLQEGGAPS